LIRLKQFQEAESLLLELYALYSEEKAVLEALFDLYLKSSSFKQAGQILNQLLEIEPSSNSSLLRQGDYFFLTGKIEDAEKIFNDIYERNQDPSAGWRLAKYYYKKKQYKKAEFYFDQVVTRLNDKPSLLFLGFQIKRQLNQSSEAIDLIESAINIASYPEFYRSQKMEYLTEIKGISAEQWEKSLKYSDAQEQPEMIKQVAEKFIKEKKFKKAEEYFLKLIKIDPQPYYKNRLGYVYYKQKKYQLALELFLQSPVKSFLVPSFVNMLIKAAIETDKNEKVIDFLKTLIEKQPQMTKLWGAIHKLAENEED